MDQRDRRVRDLGRPARLLRALGRPGRPARARRARPRGRRRSSSRWSDDVCTGLQLVNFLQDVPRDLALGRVYLPAEDRRRFGVDGARPRRTSRCARCSRFEAARARGLLAAGERCASAIGGRVGRAVGLFARGGLAALDALEARDWDIFTRRPAAVALRLARELSRRSSDDDVEQAYAEVERLTRARARNFAYGIMVLPRPKRRAIAAIYAFAREVDDIADGELADRREARAARGAARARSTRRPDDDAMLVALADARARYPIPGEALHDLVDGGLRTRADALRDLRRAARLLPARRRRGRRRLRRRLRRRRAAAGGDARRRAPADQHHPRRRARTGSSAASTCRRTSSRRSASPRTTSPPGG